MSARHPLGVGFALQYRRRGDRAPADDLLQAAILALSMAAAWMVASDGEWHRWGFVVGLASQPLWLAAIWRARQWGMFALSIVYCGAWASGIAHRFTF